MGPGLGWDDRDRGKTLAEVEKIREAAKERKGGRPKADDKPSQTIETVSRADRSTDAKRAKLAGTNRQYIHDADTLAALKLRAERKAGELLAATITKGRPEKGSQAEPLLSDLGVTKKESHNWQAIATVPADQFEACVAPQPPQARLTRSERLTTQRSPRTRRVQQRGCCEAVFFSDAFQPARRPSSRRALGWWARGWRRRYGRTNRRFRSGI